MWLASTMPGLTASRSRQRRPLPNFSAAIFHRESPGFTTMAWSFAAPFGAAGPTGATRAIEVRGAGRDRATSTPGGCDGTTRAVADLHTLGRATGERFPGAW